MRHLTILVVLLLIVQKSFASYNRTTLPELIIDSELILQGKIIHQDSTTFTLLITDPIKGNYQKKSIRIQKFEDWECANRLTKYKVGQEEIVFLRWYSKTKKWYIKGAGDEGELFIKNDSIIYPSACYAPDSGCVEINYFEYKTRGRIYSLQNFKKAINFYINQFPQLLKGFKANYSDSIPNRLQDNKAYTRIIKESLLVLMHHAYK